MPRNEWEIESDLDSLQRSNEVRRDLTRMQDAKDLAKKKLLAAQETVKVASKDRAQAQSGFRRISLDKIPDS